MGPERVNIAVVGLGCMCKRDVQTLIRRVTRVSVVAVCSSMPHEVLWAKQNEEYEEFESISHDSYDDMLNHPGLQAVWISTSTDVHAHQALGGIKKRLHVLYEKPRSTDLEEACIPLSDADFNYFGTLANCNVGTTGVDEAAKHMELKVMAGFSGQFDESYRDAAVKIHQDRAIGTPFMMRSNTCDLLDTTGFFVKYAKRNGGIFVDCAIHDVDLFLWYLKNPSPKAFCAAGTLQYNQELAESQDVDNGIGVVQFWDGKVAYFYCSRARAHGHGVCTEVAGTDGKIMVNAMPQRRMT